jgi:hypothetical protein
MANTVEPVALRTHRVIGAVLVAGGRALDLALVETDGGRHLRRIESGRVPLPRSDLDHLVDALERFMGDRALQPFAVDLIGLSGRSAEAMRSGLAKRLDVIVVAVPHAAQATPARRTALAFAAAERIAIAALAAHLSTAV